MCVAMRQVALEAGYGFPCWLMNIASAMGTILFPFPLYFRAAKAVVVSRPDFRRRWMSYFTHRGLKIQVSAAFLRLLVYGGAQAPGHSQRGTNANSRSQADRFARLLQEGRVCHAPQHLLK